MVYYWNSSNASPVKPTVHCDYSTGNCYDDTNGYAYYCNLEQHTCPGNDLLLELEQSPVIRERLG
jgi:hypothetical protein